MKAYRTIMVLLGADHDGWLAAPLLRKLYDKKTWLAVTLPGEPRPTVPEVFSDCEVLDWRLDEEDALVEAIVKRLPHTSIEAETKVAPRTRSMTSQDTSLGSAVPMQPFTDSVSGTEFLPVPGGSFTMGSDDLFTAKERKTIHEEWIKAPTPACRVRLSPFWVASTPETPPGDRLACYGLDSKEGKPASVGSYPEGAGPFGHLDMAGLVWEWCRDGWEPDYSRWAKGEPLDPVGQGDQDLRPLRGGAWDLDAGVLRSAIRYGFRPRSRRDFIGFRLLWCPPSTVS